MALKDLRLAVALGVALVVGLVSPLAWAPSAEGAGSLPSGFGQERFAGGLSGPTAMEFAPDGRLFVTEQRGTLRVFGPTGGNLGVALDIRARVDDGGERGLLGVALDPNFGSNRYVYLYYTQRRTAASAAHNRVSRFALVGDRVQAGSERVLVRLPNLNATNHNGGAIHFGEDGKLYVAVGDNSRGELAPSLGSVFGKVLRINQDGSIPRDNPFYSRTTGNNRAIWARGFRNPYSFDVQPGTGRIFANDVGQQTWEEINNVRRGGDYGWPRYEGPEGDASRLRPVFAYRHDGRRSTTGCAITGGVFYNPPASAALGFPSAYRGDYFFADFCSGWIRRYDAARDRAFAFKGASNERPVDLKVGANGDLYYLTRAGDGLGPSATGAVKRIRYGS